MEQITIKVGLRDIVVVDGRLTRARLKYVAPGLEIYVLGAVTVRRRDIVNYHAMAYCRARHIPLKQLVSYGWV